MLHSESPEFGLCPDAGNPIQQNAPPRKHPQTPDECSARRAVPKLGTTRRARVREQRGVHATGTGRRGLQPDAGPPRSACVDLPWGVVPITTRPRAAAAIAGLAAPFFPPSHPWTPNEILISSVLRGI